MVHVVRSGTAQDAIEVHYKTENMSVAAHNYIESAGKIRIEVHRESSLS